MKKVILIYSFILLSGFLFAQENCGNGIDDDGDGLIDCADPDCKSATIPTGAFFNTGSNGANGVLPGGSPDFHWQISTGSIAGPYTPAIVMSVTPPTYYNSPWPNCKWISHSSTGFQLVDQDYYYKVEFQLPCSTPCGLAYSDSATFCLNMDFFSDNSVNEIYVNNIPQSAFINGVPAINQYQNIGYNPAGKITTSICRSWKGGLNTLIIKVSSGVDYEGFLAQNSTTIPPVVIPDPTITSILSDIVCEQAPPINLQAATAGGTWTSSCGNCINTATGIFTPSIAGAGTHTVIYTIGSPCNAADTATITIARAPTISVDPDQNMCSGENSKLVTITSSPGATFKWVATATKGIKGFALNGTSDIPVQTITSTETTPGTVTYAITPSLSGCTGPATNHVITVNPAPTASFYAPAITSIYDPTVNFTNYSTKGTSWDWNFGDQDSTNNSSTLENPTHTYSKRGIYCVALKVIDARSCPDSFSLCISIEPDFAFYIPNAFTPNNDGINDDFFGKGESIKEYEMYIFDRWGLTIFHTNDLSQHWDGKVKGSSKLAMGDTYVYAVYITDIQDKKHKYTGTVTLVR
jgi:gliding motility-associated-like protein